MAHLRNALLLLLLPSLCALSRAEPVLERETEPARKPDRKLVTLECRDGTSLRYALVRPADFDEDRAYPVLVALPPGSQDEQMVEVALNLYWEEEALRRGWIVVSPAARTQALAAAMPELIERLAGEVIIEGGKVHLAGVSNGGRAAFELITQSPERYASLLVLPGFPSSEEASGRLDGLAGLPIAMFVGGEDGGWLAEMERTLARLEALGNQDAFLYAFDGEGHQPGSLNGGTLLFDTLDEQHEKHMGRRAARAAVGGVLDDFHLAASEADGERYFAHFAPRAVFLGTDASERWTVAEFKSYANPFFSQGQGWTYHPRDRHVFLSPSGATAWFDERLDNEKYGEVRGSGVLVRIGRGWHIAQYNLAFPVPNDLVAPLIEMIRAR